MGDLEKATESRKQTYADWKPVARRQLLDKKIKPLTLLRGQNANPFCKLFVNWIFLISGIEAYLIEKIGG